MRALRNALAAIGRAAQWIDDHNKEPRSCYGMRNSSFLWMMSLFCVAIAVGAAFSDQQFGWRLPIGIFAASGIPFGAGLAFYLDSRRATAAVVGTMLTIATAAWHYFGPWAPLTIPLACLAGVAWMLALVQAPIGDHLMHDDGKEEQPAPARAAERPMRDCRKVVT